MLGFGEKKQYTDSETMSEKDKSDEIIARANEKMTLAENELFEAYFCKIKESFQSGNKKLRSRILCVLSSILQVSAIEECCGIFSHAEATAIRMSAKIKTAAELALKLGISRSLLYGFESGKLFPNRVGHASLKYLAWLKDHGYNPFNL